MGLVRHRGDREGTAARRRRCGVGTKPVARPVGSSTLPLGLIRWRRSRHPPNSLRQWLIGSQAVPVRPRSTYLREAASTA